MAFRRNPKDRGDLRAQFAYFVHACLRAGDLAVRRRVLEVKDLVFSLVKSLADDRAELQV